MRIGDVKTQRDIANVVLGAKGPAAEFVTDEQLQEADRAKRELGRVQTIMRSGKAEIPRSELSFGRYPITHEPTGVWWREFGGDPQYPPHIPAFYVREDGTPVLLERVGSQSEHEKQLARRARPGSGDGLGDRADLSSVA